MSEFAFNPEREIVIERIRLRNALLQDYRDNKEEYELSISFKPVARVDSNALLSLVHLTLNTENKKVAVFDYEFGFQLEDLKKFKVKGTKSLSPILGATVNSIAYSTIRGLVFAYTLQAGRPIILPVIAAKDLISEYKTTFKQ